VRKQRQHLFFLQLVALYHLVHKGDDFGALEIETRVVLHGLVPRTHGCDEQKAQDDETGACGNHYELTNFLCEYSAMRIPKPASRVTTEVPP
jgi:hypothetical protein